MSSVKTFFAALTIVSVVLKICSIILSKTKFEKIFKSISGIIILGSIFSVISSCKADTISYFKENHNDVNVDINTSYHYKTDFETRLKSMIQNDIHNIYYVNLNVNVKTDFETLKIYIIGKFDTDVEEQIKNYVQKKYCNSNDEVIINNVSRH